MDSEARHDVRVALTLSFLALALYLPGITWSISAIVSFWLSLANILTNAKPARTTI